MYGVFVRTQDESSAMTKAYATFVKEISNLVKEQLRTRELIEKHLEEKAGRHSELEWKRANEEVQQAYSLHRSQALAKMSSLIKTKTQESPYEAFIMGLGLYIVGFLVNSIENDPE